MNTTQRWSAALAVCVLGAGLFAWQRPPAGEPPSAAPAVQPAARPNAAMHARAPVRTQAPDAPAADEPPLSVQIDHLLATHKPLDAFRAYSLLADCAAFNANHDRVVFDPDEPAQGKPISMTGLRGLRDDEKRNEARLCAGMTERQRQSRLEYLAVAAHARVPGAVLAFVSEGPFGDPSALQTRPDDLLVKEWKSTANALLVDAAENADPTILDILRMQYASGSDVTDRNPVLAFRYGMALSMIYAEGFGKNDLMVKVTAQQAAQAAESADGFTPAQRAAELAAARRIADVIKARREAAEKSASHG
jgi:hypothetical protein